MWNDLAPGRGIPLHKHPYAEFFCVLEGKVDFQRWNDAGETEWITCGAGATALAPPNAPHTFFNRSEQTARFIATSTYHHELMVKESKTPTGILNEGYSHPTPEGFERLNKSQERDHVYYLKS
jgi:quercetin dioxygenase-like cupin family protein